MIETTKAPKRAFILSAVYRKSLVGTLHLFYFHY